MTIELLSVIKQLVWVTYIYVGFTIESNMGYNVWKRPWPLTILETITHAAAWTWLLLSTYTNVKRYKKTHTHTNYQLSQL